MYIYIYIFVYTYVYVSCKLATIYVGDQRAPFSKATAPRCTGGRYSFPWIPPLYP